MKTKRPRLAHVVIASVCAMSTLATAAFAQHAPAARGSLDAVTILPTTAATGTQPAASMPAGHPQIGNGGEENPLQAMHEGMSSAKTGALRVIVSQGTKEGPPIGKDSVRVELLARGVPIKTYLTNLDEKGIIELHDLPLDVPFQPVVTVIHGGAEQQRVGAAMYKYQPAVELHIPVYETTTDKPAWTVGLRDVEAQAVAAEGGEAGICLRLTDLIGGFDPADRAWTGEGAGNQRQTMEIPLAAAAANVQFGPGMGEAGARFVHGAVVRGKTMLPGSTQYVFAYDLPVKEGRATATFTAPADTTLFALYVPGDWKVEKTSGLELGDAGGEHATGHAQLLKAKGIKAGAVVSVELSGIKIVAPAATKAAETFDQTTDLHLQPPTK